MMNKMLVNGEKVSTEAVQITIHMLYYDSVLFSYYCEGILALVFQKE